MKQLLFIFLIIFSSQSFAKSPAGKVSLLSNDSFPNNSKGWVFLDEENVEALFIFRQKVVSRKLPYETTLNKVNIYKDDKRKYGM